MQIYIDAPFKLREDAAADVDQDASSFTWRRRGSDGFLRGALSMRVTDQPILFG